VLRIEDTDQARNQPELIDNIIAALTWLGIDWDEGPFFQSQRADRHREAVAQLVRDGRAYEDEGAIRFRVPDRGTTGWDDVVRGRVEFENEHLEDFVVQRSNGTPMFLLANAVDDLDMGITHIIRGEDMVNNVPKQLLVMDALGARPDDIVYAHLPLLVDEQRRKLSKRFGDVAVEQYREKGYVAPAMANYLALLGWGPPDEVEIRPMAEIVERFRLEDVNKSSAFFDVKKLNNINGVYLREMTPGEFATAAKPWGYDLTAVPEALRDAVQVRAHTLGDVPWLIDWFFADEPEIDPAAWAKHVDTEVGPSLLDATLAVYADAPWRADELLDRLRAVGESLGVKLAKAQAPIRVAVTGRAIGPPLFESLEALGRERTLSRLQAALDRL
jgi:glutamyl-tRNA synthetase